MSSAKYDLFCLQELHGNDCDTNELRKYLGNFVVDASYCKDGCAGGVAVGVRRNPFFQAEWENKIVEAGRCVALVAKVEDAAVCFCSMHVDPNAAAERKEGLCR